MADYKIKLCPDKLFALLPFTAIASLALIISGITLFSFSTEMAEKDVVKQIFKIDYTRCIYYLKNYDTCEESFKENKQQTRCRCYVMANLTEYLRGKVFVDCVLEIADQGSKIDSTSVKTFTDEIKNTPGQCDPYNTQETTVNETCEVIPDSIFNVEFALLKYNLTTGKSDPSGLNFNKAVGWRLDENNSATGLQNTITVAMNTTKDLPAGPYLLLITAAISSERPYACGQTFTFVISGESYTQVTHLILNQPFWGTLPKVQLSLSFYRNENIGRRYFIFSTRHEVYYRSRVIEIIALALGLVLAAASIALIVKWIAGVKSNTLPTAVTADEPTANNGVSRTLPEETPLAAHVNNEQS